GVSARFDGQSFFNEFVIDLPVPVGGVIEKMYDKGFAAGFPLSCYYPEMENSLLIAVTEKRTKQHIDSFAQALEAVL
ncbi:MAG: glycine dehydrogenase, partial [Planctomycetes bacterium]|nr:glycine dehydrogenase [Planctomycetota bacterium]